MTWRVTIITATSEVVVLSSSTPNIILVHDKMGHGRRSAFFLRGRNFYDVRAVQCSGAAEGAHSLCHPTSLLSPVPPSLPPPPLLAAWPFYEISPSDADEGTEGRRGEWLPSAAVPLYSDTRDAIPGKIIVLRGQSGNHVDDIFSKIKALAELSMHPKSLLHLCVCLLVTFRWRCWVATYTDTVSKWRERHSKLTNFSATFWPSRCWPYRRAPYPWWRLDRREGGRRGGDVGTLMRKRREHANSGGKNWSGRTRTALRQSRLPPSLMLLGEVACKGGQGGPIPQFNLSISPLPSIFIFSFKLRTEMENNPLHFCSTRNCMIHYSYQSDVSRVSTASGKNLYRWPSLGVVGDSHSSRSNDITLALALLQRFYSPCVSESTLGKRFGDCTSSGFSLSGSLHT